jgi:hypothetical protein
VFFHNLVPTNKQAAALAIAAGIDMSMVSYESITLLKNKNNLLPLSPSTTQKILVTGPAGNSLGVQSGGWSIHVSQPTHGHSK